MNYPEGLRIASTIEIESPQHLAEVLADASDTNTPVLPVGGGVCLDTGNAVDHEFVALDLTSLSGIEDYIPTDMTASFQAGTSLREIKTALAANGQELPVPIPDDDAGSIGGLVATGYAGASRLGKGTLKDVLIGCEYVTGGGLLAKAGGMTVKNVSGFEVSRLLHGSWGSLAVLTRVNLKVIPIARATRSLSWQDDGIEAALDRQRQAMTSMPYATAIETISAVRGFVTTVTLEGRESALDAYLSEAIRQFGEPSPAIESSRPSGTQLVVHGSVQQISDLAMQAATCGSVALSMATGSLRVQLNPGALPLDDVVKDLSNSWMIEGGPHQWKQGHSVWGPARADASVMRSIKNEFDPANVLNRGRLFV